MSSHANHYLPARRGLFPALLYGFLMAMVGLGIYLLGVVIRPFLTIVDPHDHWKWIVELMVWYSGVPTVIGLCLILLDLFLFLPRKRTRELVCWDPPKSSLVTVVLTAYNDEASIGSAVEEFKCHPKVKRVVVVDNNSKDSTSEVARGAGAIVVNESRAGYGNCVWRCFSEGIKYADTELTVLCEGDMTFRSYDIDKLLAYIPHVDIVNGTRIVEQLRCRSTQLSTFMFYGNFFAGKLLEAKYIGQGTFTDVGTTYKMCRNSALERLLPLLNRDINLEFNAHFMDAALANGFAMVECPITFHSRVGVSKGGNVNNSRALKVGFRMIKGITLGWEKQT